jgi:uncharacterized protein
MIKSISKTQVLDRLRFENPWWVTKRVDSFFDLLPKRKYFDPFSKLAATSDVKRSVVLLGPRRVGKTVLLHHWVQALIDAGVNAHKIIFITLENPVYNQLGLEQLFSMAREASGETADPKGWYVIFDEVQYLKEWDVHLKSLAESYRDCKFIVSGSAAATLQNKSKESGAGRFIDFLLPPITFHEFIDMQDLDHLLQPVVLSRGGRDVPMYKATDIRLLNKLFLDYINFGGYPEAIFSKTVRKNPERFIRQDIIDKVLMRDLPNLYGISDLQELNALFATIAFNTGQEFSLEKLSQQSGIQKNTIRKYLHYLESAFLIRIVKRTDQSGKRFKRENFFKIFLVNASIRSALFSPVLPWDETMGAMAETAIYGQWMHRANFTPYYARWSRGEVDMIGLNQKNLQPAWALEIKWSDKVYQEPSRLKSLVHFCGENNLKQALVTTIHHHEVKMVGELEITFIPCSTYAYTVGLNTINASP